MKQQRSNVSGFIVNNLLLVSGVIMIVSGFVLQIGFHVGNQRRNHETLAHVQRSNIEHVEVINPTDTVWNIDYATWSIVHKASIVFFTLLMIYHLVNHWKWYKLVFFKRVISKNHQLLILSVLFVAVALTGLIPWFIDLSGYKGFLRLILIEIHDKLAILFFLYLLLHVVKKIKWFKGMYMKLRKK